MTWGFSPEQLKSELPNFNQPKEKFEECLKINSQLWSNKLRKLIIKYRNICHDWQFNDEQLFALKDYYHANGLLLNCLNSNCYVSREVRQEIEDTLLLPASENRKTQYNQSLVINILIIPAKSQSKSNSKISNFLLS